PTIFSNFLSLSSSISILEVFDLNIAFDFLYSLRPLESTETTALELRSLAISVVIFHHFWRHTALISLHLGTSTEFSERRTILIAKYLYPVYVIPLLFTY